MFFPRDLMAQVRANSEHDEKLTEYIKSYSDVTLYRELENELDLREEEKAVEKPRISLYPVEDEESYNFYQHQEAITWFSAEIGYMDDIKDYLELPSHQKKMINKILSFFMIGDGIIIENIGSRFLSDNTSLESRGMYISQLHIEYVHADVYGMFARAFHKDWSTFKELLESIRSIPCVVEKSKFMKKWTRSSSPKLHRYVAAVCSEGIFFQSLFIPIFWFRRASKLKGFIFANEMIRRDETLHMRYMMMLALREIEMMVSDAREKGEDFIALKWRLLEEVKEIILEASRVEFSFIRELIETPTDDLTSENVIANVKLIINEIAKDLGIEENLFDDAEDRCTWAAQLSMEEKTNFFETKSGAYSRGSPKVWADWKSRMVTTKSLPPGIIVEKGRW